jgi:hypothetical protein
MRGEEAAPGQRGRDRRQEEHFMDQAERRRRRMAQLLDLAQTYKGWTRKDLARSLGRDPTKLIPGSGVPKLDLVVDLANVLDWPVDDVVDYLWSTNGTAEAATTGDDFDAIDDAARRAHRSGRYAEMISLAERAFEVAETPEQRARACNREAGGWDGLGRYSNTLKAIQRGLSQSPVSPEYRRMLQSNLANAYYSIWSLIEAKSIAGDLLYAYREEPPVTVRDRKTQAFAHYVVGHTLRRMMGVEPQRLAEFAIAAERHLSEAEQLYQCLAVELDDESFNGIANTCAGGLIETNVALGRQPAAEALEQLSDGLESVRDLDGLVGDRLESYGWWCIFGCNIALRHLDDERVLQQFMAVFTNKADEIAERLDNWCMRERVFTMDHARWERAVGCTGFDIPRVVDEDDVRIITGTMARFPTFRDTGWRILRSARVVRA